MVASEAFGIPVGFHLAAANRHDATLALDTLSTVRVPRSGCGRPKTRILELAMDKGFDSRELRRALTRRGIRASIPLIKRRGKRRQRGPRPKLYPVSRERYKVERVNAWLDNYRGLVVRYERNALHYLAYCTLAAILLCFRRLLG